MDRKYTKAQARELFQVPNDHQLSKALGTSHQRIGNYADEDELSIAFQWQIRALIAEGKIPGKQEAA